MNKQPTIGDHVDTNAPPDQTLRGFEIVKRFNGVLVQTGMKYRPTELGVRQAAADCKWLAERHPDKGYELRALVSVPREVPPSGGAIEVDKNPDAPLESDDDGPKTCPTCDGATQTGWICPQCEGRQTVGAEGPTL